VGETKREESRNHFSRAEKKGRQRSPHVSEEAGLSVPEGEGRSPVQKEKKKQKPYPLAISTGEKGGGTWGIGKNCGQYS